MASTITRDVIPLTPAQCAFFLGSLLLTLPLRAQSAGTPSAHPPGFWTNRNLVFLDPAHGGDDAGAQLSDHLPEKDATIALAMRLRGLLSSQGISVLMAREPVVAPRAAPDATPGTAPPSPPAPLMPNADARAGAANHAHPFACILLHATASGSGVHIVTSPLPQADNSDSTPSTPIAWNSAQSSFVSESDRLAAELGTALSRTGLAEQRLRSSVRPIDNLLCPAVALELAPTNGISPASPEYQQRVAQAVSTALQFWRGQSDAAAHAADTSGGSAP